METIELTGPVLWRTGSGTPPVWSEDPIYVEEGCLTRTPKYQLNKRLSGWVISGLVDVHAHIGIEWIDFAGTKNLMSSSVMEQQAIKQRQSGVLAIRDCGSPEDNGFVQQRKDLPRLIRCGHHIARPKRYIRGLSVDLADVNELPEEVAKQAAISDGWVKIVADWIDRSAGAAADLTALWPKDVLVDAVAAAHEAGARMTAHTFSHGAVDDLLAAGIDCIEHGTGMDDDQITECAQRNIPVTPTLLQVGLFAQFANQARAKYPVYAQTMKRMYENRYEQLMRLYEAGVQLLPGTDSGGYQEHGHLPAELKLWEYAGIPPAKVLDFTTWQCRDYLGLSSMEEGASADVVVYAADPAASAGVYDSVPTIILRGIEY